MKRLIFIILTVTSFNCYSQSKNFIDQNYIEVTGKAEMEIIPDEIYLKIYLNEKDFKGKGNLEEIEKAMIDKLKGLGIDISKDLAIIDMASNFKRYWIKSTEINSIKEFQLMVRDAKTAGNVFTELESIGISSITIDRVDHTEILKYKEQVKVAAITAARHKAETLLIAINQICGKAIFIQELNNQNTNNNFPGYITANSNISIRTNSFSSIPEIEFKKIKIEFSILARFEIN